MRYDEIKQELKKDVDIKRLIGFVRDLQSAHADVIRLNEEVDDDYYGGEIPSNKEPLLRDAYDAKHAATLALLKFPLEMLKPCNDMN